MGSASSVSSPESPTKPDAADTLESSPTAPDVVHDVLDDEGDDSHDGAAGGSSLRPQPEKQSERALVKDARVCFYFDQGKSCGTYIGPSKRRQDKGQDLHRVRWDDGGRDLVNLSYDRRFDGDVGSSEVPPSQIEREWESERREFASGSSVGS